MTSDIRQHLAAQPFIPFTVHVAGGREYRIPTPDHTHAYPSGGRVSIFHKACGLLKFSFMQPRPVADRFMTEAQRLRSRNATRAEVEGRASVLYPSNSATDKTMRSRLWRACSVPAASFASALEAYRRGANSSELLVYLGRNSKAGAPKGNLNGAGKKWKSSEKRFEGMWRAMSREEQDRFLAAHELRRA